MWQWLSINRQHRHNCTQHRGRPTTTQPSRPDSGFMFHVRQLCAALKPTQCGARLKSHACAPAPITNVCFALCIFVRIMHEAGQNLYFNSCSEFIQICNMLQKCFFFFKKYTPNPPLQILTLPCVQTHWSENSAELVILTIEVIYAISRLLPYLDAVWLSLQKQQPHSQSVSQSDWGQARMRGWGGWAITAVPGGNREMGGKRRGAGGMGEAKKCSGHRNVW